MTASCIEVRGARQNNLTGVDVDVPKGQLVVFTGLSGSGKSSLVFGTIAAESQRLINETYTAFLQSLMPSLPRPDVDRLSNLSAAIVVDQEPTGANTRSTVGTATDTWTLLRVLFSKIGTPAVANASALSFNDPSGMCDVCDGVGTVSSLDVDGLLDTSLSLNGGAILFPNFAVGSLFWKVFSESGFFENDQPLDEWSQADIDRLLNGEGGKIKTGPYNVTYEGLLDKLQRLYLDKDIEALQPHIRKALHEIATFSTCPVCAGSRLNAAARNCSIDGVSIADCAVMQIDALASWTATVDVPEVQPLLSGLVSTLDNLVEVGLGYLSLNRQTGTLSGGEAQRMKTVRHLDSALTDLTYVFDEPTAGLHPADTTRMIQLLQRLRDKGNTVLVVEHDTDVITAADHVIDLGPGAGTTGGTITFQGTVSDLAKSDTATGRHLGQRQLIKTHPRTPSGELNIKNAGLHNLHNVSVSIPLGVLTAVTGVSGSGKSSLILGSIPPSDDVVVVDQTPIRGSKRSTPATYTGVFDDIRKMFAKANNVKPALFSFNSDGACEQCNGLGVIYTDLAYLPSVATPCEGCSGRRYTGDVLDYQLRSKSIADVLEMSISEAAEFFTDTTVAPMLASLVDVGIGYIGLGQTLSTLSGGERQRLRLAIEMTAHAEVYILDEPSTGLHVADVDHLIGLLDRITDNGATVIVIEHNLDIIARSDHVIDLGPGAGADGGTIVFQGPPAHIDQAPDSKTGQHLHAAHALEPA